MGTITVTLAGSFGTQGQRQFSAMEHGHAAAVADMIAFLALEVLPNEIKHDHELAKLGKCPTKGFGKP